MSFPRGTFDCALMPGDPGFEQQKPRYDDARARCEPISREELEKRCMYPAEYDVELTIVMTRVFGPSAEEAERRAHDIATRQGMHVVEVQVVKP